MKELKITLGRDNFDAVLSGEKSVITREIRPNTAKRYIEYFNTATGEVYPTDVDIPDGCESVDARPIAYDALRVVVKDGPSALVKVADAQIYILTDEDGKDVIYEHDGKRYYASQIDYTLGDVIEQENV